MAAGYHWFWQKNQPGNRLILFKELCWLIFSPIKISSHGEDLWCRQKGLKVIFMLPKNYHFSSEQGSKVMQKTADILLGTKCQRKKQSGRGTEELIYVYRGGFYMSKLFMGTAPRPHLAMSQSQVQSPPHFPFHSPPHSILRLSSKKPPSSTLWRPARSYIAPITVKLELQVKRKCIYNWNSDKHWVRVIYIRCIHCCSRSARY